MEIRQDNHFSRVARRLGVAAGILGTIAIPVNPLTAANPQVPERPYLPSGITCADKVSFYIKHRGIAPGKIATSECDKSARKRELLLSINAIEEAARAGNRNPIGLMRIASSESRLETKVHDYASGRHRGLFQIGTYNVPRWSSGAKLMASRYFKAEKRRNPKATMKKLDGNLYNPRSNAFMAVWAINNYGPGPWTASVGKWGSMRNYIVGDKAQYRDFLNIDQWMVGINVNYGLEDGV